ncbi:MAG: TIGR03936 family radical SAM-associated protein [Eubacteriales bacterium]|nr:TIGR03936 family radical SAM-associated protein [Eubacteriales bacterium]MDY3285583.1 TIGR03936 family radical SAM-associated protein [Eubacteriales bacterium]MDY5015688.1 TIGR03936 family radical SAM-associated protein [Eubacteriales bacterium]
MLKCRMQYEKRGPAQYISHLDLMRVFRRAFMRAGVMLSFSQGFNPHPYISVPLPLPTGFSSRCDLLDFDTESLPDDFLARMTAALPEGIVPRYVYQRTRGAGDIAAVRYTVTLHGEGLVPEDVRALFSAPVMMLKRTKRGESEVDLCTFIRSLDASSLPDGSLALDAVLAAGEQSLNPEYLVRAIDERTPGTVAWADYLRTAILDRDGEIFA